MFILISTSKFRRDLKKCEKRGLDIEHLELVVDDLVNKIPLGPRYRLHRLEGEYKGCLECHIEPDWLLIFRVRLEVNKIYLMRTGTHSDLFG